MEEIFDHVSSLTTNRGLSSFFLIRPGATGHFEIAPITHYKSFFANVTAEQVRILVTTRKILYSC